MFGTVLALVLGYKTNKLKGKNKMIITAKKIYFDKKTGFMKTTISTFKTNKKEIMAMVKKAKKNGWYNSLTNKKKYAMVYTNNN